MALVAIALARPAIFAALFDTAFVIAGVQSGSTGIRVHSNATHLKPSQPESVVAVDFRDGSSLKAIWENLYVQ